MQKNSKQTEESKQLISQNQRKRWAIKAGREPAPPEEIFTEEQRSLEWKLMQEQRSMELKLQHAKRAAANTALRILGIKQGS